MPDVGNAEKEAVGRSASRAYAIVGVLFLVQVTNFWDKAVVSLAAAPIMEEFGLSPAQYGVIAGAFFALYAVGGLAVAMLLAPRMTPSKIMALLLLVWSLLQLPIVFAASYPVIVLCRLLLGFGEGAGAPTALNATHEWFSNRDRNVPSAIVLLGATIGSLLAPPILTAVITTYGWRMAFLACSALGIVTLGLWLLVGRSGPYAAGETATEFKQGPATRTKSLSLWTDHTILGSILAGFTAYWVVGFVVGWLAPFTSHIVGDAQAAAWAMSAIFAVQAILVLVIPLLSERLLKSGVTSRRARGWTTAACIGGAGLALLAAAILDSPAAVLGAMAMAIGLTAPVFPLVAAMISEVAPADQRNGAITVIFSLITVSAVASSMGTGWLVGAAGAGWNAALIMHGIIALAGATAAFTLLNPERSIAMLALAADGRRLSPRQTI